MSKEKEMSFLDHLEELRWHLIRSIGSILFFAIMAFVSKDIVFGVILLGPSKSDFWTYKVLCDLGKNIGDILSVNIQNQEIKMTWSKTYQSDGVNQVGLITDSWGMISIFAKNKNASEIIGVIDGEKIDIKK